MKYSKITGCFYPSWGKYNNLPADTIEVTEDEFSAAMSKNEDEYLDIVNGRVVVLSSDNEARLLVEQRVLYEADTETNRIIEKGFVYNGNNVRLTVEDQKNILVLWLTRDIQSYPRTIKIWNNGLSPVLYTFANATELNNFFLAGISHIDNAIMTGVQIKAAAAIKTTEELKAWKDPRKE